MKKKEIIKGTVDRIGFPNIGIISTEDGDIRVKNALPGQELSVQIQKARRGKYEARILEIISPSPLENEKDLCEHFGKCGGCLYASIPYEEEIKIKESQVSALLSKVLGKDYFDDIYQGILGSPKEYEYRNKMEFSFGDEYKGGPLSLGMHKRGAFYDIVTVSGCRIVDSDYRSILTATLEYFKEQGTAHYNKNTHEGFLRHLLLRKAAFTGEILIDIVTASGIDDSLIDGYKDRILELSLCGKVVSILHTINDRISDVVEDQGTRVLFGEDYFTEHLLGLSFKISPFSFFQTNSYGAKVLYDEVKSLMPKSGIVFDLYCGTGTIAQIVSPNAGQVVGVEIVKEAVSAAKANARLNRIDNVRFIAEDVLKALDDIPEKPDTIILDPPREGVHPKALKKILSYGVEEIIYVSCKPTSLARDLEIFLENGYRPDYIRFVDMFPRTANIETICRIKRS